MKPKAQYKYAGPLDEVICQGRIGNNRCHLPVKEYGPVKINAHVTLMLYRCEKGHYFAVERVPSHADYAGATVYAFNELHKAVFGARL